MTATLPFPPETIRRPATISELPPASVATDHLALGTRDGLAYAMLEGDPWLMTIAPDDFEALRPEMESLRDRRILPIAADQVVQIDAHRGDTTATLTRQADRWVRADGAPVDTATVEALLADLTEPRVTDFVASYSSLTGFGLTAPQVRFTCTDRDGAVHTILIGDADSRQRVYVKYDNDHTVMMAHAPQLAAATVEP